MVIQCIDGSVVETYELHRPPEGQKQSYYTEIPHHLLDGVDELIDRMIGFAFDTMRARHIELRVVDPETIRRG